MIQLKYKGRNWRILKAQKIANKLFASEAFYKKIEERPGFDNTFPETLTGKDIANFIRNHPKNVYIKTYIAPTGGNAKTSRSTFFKINKSRLRRSTESIVRTMVHETVHCVDFALKEYQFTHVDNSNDHGEEDNTAPWAIGYIAEDMAKEIINNQE